MLVSRESKRFSIISLLIISSVDICGMLLLENRKMILLQTVACLVIYICGIRAINHMNNRIADIGAAARKCDMDVIEKYEEGEIGRLSQSIAEMLTLLQEAESRQRREKEFLRDIISDISHQIKTPVASLTVFNDIMLEEVSDEKYRQMLEQSEQQLTRITWLVQSLLQLARIEAEAVTFAKEPVDIRNLVEQCIDIVQMKAKEKNVKFIINGEHITAYADAEWFKEAIVNVMKNAIDYGPQGENVEVTITQTPIATKISIKDFGPGILPEDRLNIFKRFYRSDTSRTNPNNVGIGLALSKSIIEGCGGKIWVESRHISECIAGERSYTAMIIML